MRKLATIREIKELRPIEGADLIELAIVDGWQLVVKKGEFKEGDPCIYFEIDSFLPIEDRYEFLRKSSYRKDSLGKEGFRLRTIKLKKQVSQGLALPITEEWPSNVGTEYALGEDVTDVLGVTKWEPPIPADLSGKVKGGFPGFIPKTDEERVQNLVENFDRWKKEGVHFVIQEKLDGSSCTMYLKDNQFGVCSRNYDLEETEDNTFWKVARQLRIEDKLRAFSDTMGISNIAIQGELIGEGIQKNLYGIKGQTVRLFNFFNIDDSKYSNKLLTMFKHHYGIETVPEIVRTTLSEFETVEDLLKYAEGKSALNEKQEREGIVLKTEDNTIHFKAISNKFLLKEKD